MAVRCSHCNQSFEAREPEPRCPTCLRQSTVVAIGQAKLYERGAVPKLFVVGIVIWAAGMMAMQLGTTPIDPVEARWYRGTLGVFALAGFALTLAGGIRWWRRRGRS